MSKYEVAYARLCARMSKAKIRITLRNTFPKSVKISGINPKFVLRDSRKIPRKFCVCVRLNIV